MYYGTRQINKKNKTAHLALFEVFAILFIAHNRLPAVGYYMPSAIYLGLFGLTFILGINAFNYKKTYTALSMFLLGALNCVLMLLMGKSFVAVAMHIYGQLQSFLYAVIALYLIYQNDPQRCKKMFIVIILMYVITAISTIWGNIEYPQASRWLATFEQNDPLNKLYTSKNIGGFSFVYELVLIAPLLIFLIRKKLLKPLLGYALLILFGVTIFMTEYATAVLLYLSNVVLLIIPKISTKKLIIVLMVVLLLFATAGGVVADIMDNVAQETDSDVLADRFGGVADYLRGEDSVSSETTENRMMRYQKSWNTFINTLFLGNWKDGGVGGHSFVLDALAHFGLLGLVAIVVILVGKYKLCLQPYRGRAFIPYLVWCYILGVVLMVINTKVYWFVFLCAIPLFSAMLPAEQEKNKVENTVLRQE